MRFIEGEPRTQLQLMSLDSMITDENPIRLMDLMTKEFYNNNPDLQIQFGKGNKSRGRKAYSPKMMMNLLLYGYFNGIASSRKMERATAINVEVMWLMEGLRPDHWTICSFRRENKTSFKALIKKVQCFVLEQGYADGTKVVCDGSKVKAYANRTMLTKAGIMERLTDVDSNIESYLQQLDEIDEMDLELDRVRKEKADLDKSIDKLLKKQSKLKQANATLENTGNKYVAPNDPEAILVKGADGKFAGYNVQAVVDVKGHFLLNTTVTRAPNDQGLLEENVNKLTEQIGQPPEEITADKGYGVMSDVLAVEEQGVECYVPIQKTPREIKAEKGIVFTYDSETDTHTCANGQTLVWFSKGQHKDGTTIHYYKCHTCEGCPLRTQCTKSKTSRILSRREDENQIQQYKEKLNTPKAKDRIRKRKQVVEHPFGTIKMLMGKFQFLLTGQEKAQIELDLYALVYNLKRLYNIGTVCQLKKEISQYDWKIA